MHGLIETARGQQWRFVITIIGGLVGVGLWMLGQVLAAVLFPLLVALLVEIVWRDVQARALARWIAAGQGVEKIEVPSGAWGELSRAVNGMLQQRRVQQRLQIGASAPLPDDALMALLEHGLPHTTELRVVSVLAVGCRGIQRVERDRRAALTAWQTLARVAQAQAQEHGALLQPCGDALLLVFGAFAECSSETTVRAALTSAAALRRAWQSSGPLAAGPLALGLASGPALLTVVPGLGCSVLGEPVEQAVQIERQALQAPAFQIMCGESAYYVLRRSDIHGWKATEFHIETVNARAQTIYGWGQAAEIRS